MQRYVNRITDGSWTRLRDQAHMYKGVCTTKYDMEDNSVIICLLFLKENKLTNRMKMQKCGDCNLPKFAVTL